MKEFQVSEASEPIQFKIGDDVFTAKPAAKLPGNVLIRYSEQVQAGKLHEAHQQFFARALDKDSADLFAFRLDSSENPINLETMTQVAIWLMEQYSNFGGAPAKP